MPVGVSRKPARAPRAQRTETLPDLLTLMPLSFIARAVAMTASRKALQSSGSVSHAACRRSGKSAAEFARSDHSAFGDDPGDQAGGRDVERRIADGCAVTRDVDRRPLLLCVESRDLAHLARGALLDRDAGQPVVDGPVDGRRRHGRVEGHAVVVGGKRLEVRADLVGHIAAGAHAICAHQHEVDVPVLHQVTARVVDDQRVRHTVRGQLPRRQQPLAAWPRLVDPHVDRDRRVVRLVDRRQGGAEVDRRDPAGIAMRQHLYRPVYARMHRGDQAGAVRTDRAIQCDVLVRDPRRFEPGRLWPLRRRQRRQKGAQPVECPAQIHGGGARRVEPAVGVGEMRVVGVVSHGQGETVRAGHADQRRAAHRHRGYGIDHVVDRPQRAGRQTYTAARADR